MSAKNYVNYTPVDKVMQ